MNIFTIFSRLNFNTLYFNFKYFPFRKAILLPVWVSKRCHLAKCEGQIAIEAPLKTGLIQIGFENIGIFDRKRSRSIWKVSGSIVFHGAVKIGHGCKVNVGRQGHLSIGKNFYMPSESTIVCHKEIEIGNDCAFSWDMLMMDTDMHDITDEHQQVINTPAKITIGNNVWVGCRVMILKGVIIPANNIVAANALVTKPFTGEKQIIGGNPAKVIKQHVSWNHDFLH
ncbi:acyltransferase [Fulvivirgaceae bacterium BMA12]|uniref:Acyltransferase n=1 Tax=Agaribacillus aureus TaxID=3051825 RepID=A0ABT8LB29_9BACT|nr:acyltransferase [Fulvivirgaceae bacterium BMA12]